MIASISGTLASSVRSQRQARAFDDRDVDQLALVHRVFDTRFLLRACVYSSTAGAVALHFLVEVVELERALLERHELAAFARQVLFQRDLAGAVLAQLRFQIEQRAAGAPRRPGWRRRSRCSPTIGSLAARAFELATTAR